MSQLDQKILDAYRDIRRRPKLLKHLNSLEKKIKVLTKSIAKKNEALDQAEHRLKSLESAPLQSIRAWLLQSQTDKYDQSKAAYFDRIMEYKALIKEKELCQFEYEVLESQLLKKEAVETTFDQLIAQKEAAVLNEKGAVNKGLREIKEEILFKQVLMEEIQEAYFYGQKALGAIAELSEDLTNTQAMGQNKLFSKAHYQFYLEKAQVEIDEAYHFFQRFNLELKDISSKDPVEGYMYLISAEGFIGNLYKALLSYPNPAFVQKTIHHLTKIKDQLQKSLKRIPPLAPILSSLFN